MGQLQAAAPAVYLAWGQLRHERRQSQPQAHAKARAWRLCSSNPDKHAQQQVVRTKWGDNRVVHKANHRDPWGREAHTRGNLSPRNERGGVKESRSADGPRAEVSKRKMGSKEVRLLRQSPGEPHYRFGRDAPSSKERTRRLNCKKGGGGINQSSTETSGTACLCLADQRRYFAAGNSTQKHAGCRCKIWVNETVLVRDTTKLPEQAPDVVGKNRQGLTFWRQRENTRTIK